jgi:predicted nucleic acid-binding protein
MNQPCLVRDILNSELAIQPVLAPDLMVALELQKQHGLLTNDSINLDVAKRLSLDGLATADSGFNSVHGIIL